MPPPRPRNRPSTGMQPRILTPSVREIPRLAPLKPAYQMTGVYRVEERPDQHGAVWYRAVDRATGALVTRTNGMGILWQYETISATRLRRMMRDEMPGWKEEE